MTDDKSQNLRLSRFVYQALAGIALGLLVATLGGPTAISWWYRPPSGNAFSCAGTVSEALSQFVTLQLVCGGLGGVGLLVASFLLGRFLRQRKGPRPAAS